MCLKNVICVKTGLDWRKLSFKMERIRKKDDSADVTFRIVPTKDDTWQARSDLSEYVCEIVLGSGNSCVIKPLQTSIRTQRVHGS